MPYGARMGRIVLAAVGAAVTIALAAPAHAVTTVPMSPMSQSSAVRKAEEYLSMNEGFSRDGLIGQLEYDQFSEEDASAAVSSLNVDWNQQAALKAKQYMSMQGFSHSGLVSQLEYDKFTAAQAEFGASAVGA